LLRTKKMEIRWLESFIAVVEELHFGRAGQRLGRTQSAISQHIKKLEEDLDIHLLVRDRHTVTMNEAGRFFYKQAVQILSQLAFAEEELQRRQMERKPALRVGYVVGPCGDIVLNATRQWRKEGEVLHLTEIRVPEIRNKLTQEHLDVVVSPELAPPLPRNLTHETVANLQVMLAISPDHALAHFNPCRFEQLKNHPFVTYTSSFAPNYRSWVIEECQKNSVLPRFRFEASSSQDLMMTVASGTAVAIVPESYQSMARAGSVTFLRLCPNPETLGVWAWYKPTHKEKPLLQKFLHTLKEVTE